MKGFRTAPSGPGSRSWSSRKKADASKGRLFRLYTEQFIAQGSRKFFSDLAPKERSAFLRERFRVFRERRTREFVVRFQPLAATAGLGSAPSTLIEIVLADRPFLMDSLQGLLVAEGVTPRVVFHPILRAVRDSGGELKALAGTDGEGGREVQMVVIADNIPEDRWRGLGSEIEKVLKDVIRCVEDFPAISSRLNELIGDMKGRAECADQAKILEWLSDDNFIFLGLLPFKRAPGAKGVKNGFEAGRNTGLGLLGKGAGSPARNRRLRRRVEELLRGIAGPEPFLAVESTDISSNVHRRDFISVVLFSPDSQSSRETVWAIAGLFTQHSLRLDLTRIPVIGARMRVVLEGLGLLPGSHKYKEALDFLNGIPKQEIFRSSQTSLRSLLQFFLSVVDQPRLEVEIMAEGPDGVRVTVVRPGGFIPPEEMAAVRKQASAVLNSSIRSSWVVRLGGFCVFSLLMQTEDSAPLQPHVREHLQRVVREEMQTAEELLLEAWRISHGAGLDEGLARALIRGLPEVYKVGRAPVEILVDLAHLEKLHREEGRQFALRHAAGGEGVEMVVYGWEHCALSRIMPIMNNLRIFVVEEKTFEIQSPRGTAFIQSFRIEAGAAAGIEPETHQQPLRELLFRVLERQLENDPLNALLFACGFTWRQVNLMMLLRNYLVQVGSAYTKRTINETLVRRPAATCALYALFDAYFNPGLPARERKKRHREASAEFDDALREIDNLTEDRIFKRLLNLIRAALRTNYYRDAADPVIAIKFDSRAIDELPHPRPLCEIYVHGPLVEGVHLRGGRIARGGIRYSDRPDDFRIEVLGLMDTQMKKNALIVPVGSKGGYVVKDLLPYGGDPRKAGDAQYQVFMRALLSITDNLKNGKIVPPRDVVRRDGDDPYLVVAADKGTAHLSDTANRIALEEGFWLGDAFASGGSQGYDHKVIGITARGAWESVKRHFWELGTDLEKDSIRVVAIGDMSGDVFGNGMLLNRKMRLVGAFNHAHIFIDPNPDPARSYRERQRLFQKPRSSWSDYDTRLISKGGGVFRRQAKTVPLSPEAGSLLKIAKKEPSGEEVIRALLAAEVDLIWNGGIGTYIKAPEESDAEVGDHNNDAVRIHAGQCRAKVIGEGGNLGLTQAARVALDLAGKRLCTDAIDNAGGVHMSDQEVNLKILLGELVAKGRIAGIKARNGWLKKMEGSVTDTVIHRSYLQIIVLAMDRIRSRRDVQPFLSLLDTLAGEGRVDRRAERIPNAQQFQQFQNSGGGVPLPILSVLLSSSKMALFDRLTESSLLEDPDLKKLFAEYFPESLRKAHDILRTGHPLEKQIVGTMITNRVVDQAGLAFVSQTAADTGCTWPEVAGSYLLADEICQGRELRARVYALDNKMAAASQYEILLGLEDFLAGLSRDLLQAAKSSTHSFGRLPALRKTLDVYLRALPKGQTERDRAKRNAKAEEWARLGLGRQAAEKVASLPYLKGFMTASRLVAEWDLSVPSVLALEREIEGHFRFAEIERALAETTTDDPWRRQFVAGLHVAVARQRWEKMQAVLRGADRNRGGAAQWAGGYVKQRLPAVREYQTALRKVLTQKERDPVALAVVVGQVERL